MKSGYYIWGAAALLENLTLFSRTKHYPGGKKRRTESRGDPIKKKLLAASKLCRRVLFHMTSSPEKEKKNILFGRSGIMKAASGEGGNSLWAWMRGEGSKREHNQYPELKSGRHEIKGRVSGKVLQPREGCDVQYLHQPSWTRAGEWRIPLGEKRRPHGVIPSATTLLRVIR